MTETIKHRLARYLHNVIEADYGNFKRQIKSVHG